MTTESHPLFFVEDPGYVKVGYRCEDANCNVRMWLDPHDVGIGKPYCENHAPEGSLLIPGELKE